jgi:endonuclease-3 related protein
MTPAAISVPPLAEAANSACRTPPQRESAVLPLYYKTLSKAIGPMHWWPAKTRFEVIVGAILTQNTAWSNVERAIASLRGARLLTPAAIAQVPQARLARLIRPSGYFRQKARKLKTFVRFLTAEYGGSLVRMFRTPTQDLRQRLLSVWGIGRETADSILLYAGEHPVFVVDTYTHRILGRHGLIRDGKPDYEGVRAMFEHQLPRSAALYNEFHALLVHVGKHWCRTRDPQCELCPLATYLENATTVKAVLASGLPTADSAGERWA